MAPSSCPHKKTSKQKPSKKQATNAKLLWPHSIACKKNKANKNLRQKKQPSLNCYGPIQIACKTPKQTKNPTKKAPIAKLLWLTMLSAGKPKNEPTPE